ncbi:MAG: thiamine pyrophosphate-binding protein [Alphaproteobacteria bacterium]
MERLSTAEAIVERLAQNGIERLFCLPGVQNDPLFDVLFDAQDRIDVVQSRHEEGAAYMALGAALASGRPSAYCVVPGPGFLNTTTALATAQSCGAQVLALIGQIPSAYIGRGLGLLHEIPDQSGMLRALTKWSAGVRAPIEAPDLVDQAFHQLMNGRPQPVGLECPADVWAKKAAVHLPQVNVERRALPVDEDAVEAAAKLLGRAKRPLIVVGGGAQDASAEVTELAELLQAPVTAFRMGRGVVDSRSPLSVTVPIGHHLWADADVVIGIGTRLQTQQLSWGVDDDMAIIRIDLDAAEVNRLREPDVGLIGYADAVVRALIDRLPKHMDKRARTIEEIGALKGGFAEKFKKLQPQLDYLDVIRAALPEDGILVDELVQVGYVGRFAYPVYHPRTFICSGYQGTLGWGVPVSIGVQMAMQDRRVIALAGDGGFMFNVQELAIAVQRELPLVTIVFNDGAYGNVRRIQKELFGNRLIATDLVNPDFVKLAESFGAQGLPATSPQELGAALSKAFDHKGPSVIEVRCGEMPNPWEFMLLPAVRGDGAGASVF